MRWGRVGMMGLLGISNYSVESARIRGWGRFQKPDSQAFWGPLSRRWRLDIGGDECQELLPSRFGNA